MEVFNIYPFVTFVTLIFVYGFLMLMFCTKKKPRKAVKTRKTQTAPRHSSKGQSKGSGGATTKKKVDSDQKKPKSKKDSNKKPTSDSQPPNKSTPFGKSLAGEQKGLMAVGAINREKIDKTSEESTSLLTKDANKVKGRGKMRFNSITGPSISLHGSLATSGDGTIPKTDDMLSDNIADPAFKREESVKGKKDKDESQISQIKESKEKTPKIDKVKGKKYKLKKIDKGKEKKEEESISDHQKGKKEEKSNSNKASEISQPKTAKLPPKVSKAKTSKDKEDLHSSKEKDAVESEDDEKEVKKPKEKLTKRKQSKVSEKSKEESSVSS